MLEPWIIEQIRRREEEARRRREERPRLEIPAHDERWKQDPDPDRDEDKSDDEDKPERGVVIIDM